MRRFDRFADWTAERVARPWFFMACVLSVMVWAAFGPPAGWSDTHQLIINTGTTVVTFLLVALLHNAQTRFEKRVDRRFEELLRAMPDAEDPERD